MNINPKYLLFYHLWKLNILSNKTFNDDITNHEVDTAQGTYNERI